MEVPSTANEESRKKDMIVTVSWKVEYGNHVICGTAHRSFIGNITTTSSARYVTDTLTEDILMGVRNKQGYNFSGITSDYVQILSITVWPKEEEL